VLPNVAKATTIAFVNANSLKRAQSREQPSNTSERHLARCSSA
jgi:hypothetical protein